MGTSQSLFPVCNTPERKGNISVEEADHRWFLSHRFLLLVFYEYDTLTTAHWTMSHAVT